MEPRKNGNWADLPARVGEEIAGYELKGILGRGGMGCVFDATHSKLGRRSALKFLASELVGSEEYVQRFLSEARIVNSVRHPNIVDIYDFLELEHPKRVAYVMEFVDGGSLGLVLKRHRLSVRQAINVTFQMADALEAVHAHGVVHRDLKPDNVLVLGDLKADLSMVPSVKILDFGIAKASSATVDHRTMTGAILGTPSYMAPEQVAGNEVSAATDIYAVGEIFYEMVTGHRLFHGDRLQMMTQKLGGITPNFSIPDDLAGGPLIRALVLDCLQVQPDERPDMHSLAGRLTEILALQDDAGAPSHPSLAPVAYSPTPSPVPSNPSSLPPMADDGEGETLTPMAMASMAVLTPVPAGSSLWRIALVALVALGFGIGLTVLFLGERGTAAPPPPPPVPAEPAKAPPPAPVKAAPPVPPPTAPSAKPAEPPPKPLPKASEPTQRPRKRAKTRKRARRDRAALKRARKTTPKPPTPKPPKPETEDGAIIKKRTIPSW